MGISTNQFHIVVKRVCSNLLSILALSFLLLVVSGCKESQPTKEFEVKHTGALRSIMSGNLNATASLDSLNSKPNLYAIGALENLNGELQVFDGESFNSIVKDSKVVIDPAFDQKAALLVYAQVPDWEVIEIAPGLQTRKTALEEFIRKTAVGRGISIEKPFLFLLEGKVTSLDWHVIDWPEGDTEHTHQKHKDSGLNGTMENKKITIIGFFSLHHKAVFTHHTTNVHMHFKTDDGLLAGHVDDVRVGNNMILKLPRK